VTKAAQALWTTKQVVLRHRVDTSSIAVRKMVLSVLWISFEMARVKRLPSADPATSGVWLSTG
jgi:hypothetical protein